MNARDLALWEAARSMARRAVQRCSHMIAWRLARTLLSLCPGADEAIVLPAIILHDTGWKKMPKDKLARAVGPKPEFPELQREHELAGGHRHRHPAPAGSGPR